MYTHTFTTVDASKNTEKKLTNLTFFDPYYDPLCKDINDNFAIDTDEVKDTINKDINRNPNLFIETSEGIVDLIEKIKSSKGSEYLVDYQDIFTSLTSEYNLSEYQAKYILAASYQGSIAGGLTGFGSLLVDQITDPMKYMNRNGNMSKIIIEKDGKVFYCGGQKMTFDCNRMDYEGVIRDTVYANFISEDFLAATIKADLGKIGEEIRNPQVVISAFASGKSGASIIKELSKIETSIDQASYQDASKEYDLFVTNIIQANGQEALYQSALKKKLEEILLTDSKDLDSDKIENLKKLKFAPELLSEVILDDVSKRLNNFDNSGDFISNHSIRDILVDNLTKFTSIPRKYLKQFANDVIEYSIKNKGLPYKEKGFFSKVVSYIKNIFLGYKKGLVKDRNFAVLGSKLKRNITFLNKDKNSKKTSHVENLKKRKIETSLTVNKLY